MTLTFDPSEPKTLEDSCEGFTTDCVKSIPIQFGRSLPVAVT